MTIDLTKVVINSSTPGMQNTAIKNFSYSVPSQTLTTGSQQFTLTETFNVGASFNLVFAQFQMPGLDSTWRVLTGGESIFAYNTSNVFVPNGTNAYSIRFNTEITSTTVVQTMLEQYQNSPNPVTIPAFTVNLKVFVLKAPF